MNSFFSLFVLILCFSVPWGSQKHKPLQAAVEVWKGVKNLSSCPLSSSLCLPIFISGVFLPFVIFCKSDGGLLPLERCCYVTGTKLVKEAFILFEFVC